MTRKMVSGRWVAAALVVGVLVTAVPANASPLPGSWARVVAWLGSWSGLGTVLTALVGDEGPLIDPNGSWSSSGQGDEGPIIDPDGSRSTTGQGDAGPLIDPLGSRSTTGQGDEGPIIDPNGGKG